MNELQTVKQEIKPYPEKCYLPFILYPPGLYRNPMAGEKFLEENIDMDQDGDDFVLYIGIPFCRTKCKSCPYFISLLHSKNADMEDKFVDALIKDLTKWSKYRRWKTGTIRSIFIGGGTGSILRTDNLKRIVNIVFSLFKVSDDYEFTLEGNTGDYDEEKINYVVNSGINRISFGIQSFQPEMLKIIGSPHTVENSKKVIKSFRDKGFKNIHLDLMFNMPGHTLDIWKRDLEELKNLGISHFTIYLYRIHDNSTQEKLIQKGKINAPINPETPMVKAMYREAKVIAESMGFKMYMIDHFCVPGYENKYNLWNWKIYVETLAVGPGSYSYIDGFRLGTEADVEKYIEYCSSDKLLISSISDKLSERVQRERYIIFTLLYYELEFKLYHDKFKTSFLEDFEDEVERLLNKKLVYLTDDKMLLTQLGIEWHTNVILEFFNEKFWNDEKSVREPNWSLNGVMAELGTKSRNFYLGEKNQTFY